MKIGDNVRVWPHGYEKQTAEGKIMIVSDRAIAVAFSEKPVFVNFLKDGAFIHRDGFIVMLASRELTDVEGQACGPWIELSGGGHYEIEPFDPMASGGMVGATGDI